MSEAVQGGIERALIDLKRVVGYLLDPLRDPPAVYRFQGRHTQNQHVQCPANHVRLRLRNFASVSRLGSSCRSQGEVSLAPPGKHGECKV